MVNHVWMHCSLSGLLEAHVLTSFSWSKVAKNGIDLGRRHKWKLCSYMCTFSLLTLISNPHSKGKEMSFMRKWSLTLWTGLGEGPASCSVVMDLICCLLHTGLRSFCAEQKQSQVMYNEVFVSSSLCLLQCPRWPFLVHQRTIIPLPKHTFKSKCS